MSLLDNTTVPECEALFPDEAVVTAVRANFNLDITIGEESYENVPIHYHCFPLWDEQEHPHDKETMSKAFSVDDEVLVLCNEDGEPLYVVGFKENPVMCEPVIVLRKLVGDTYDYWYYVVSLQEGHHSNPGGVAPTDPHIISKWWSCSGLDEAEYYSISTPDLSIISSNACADSCGLINWDAGVCCDASQGEGDEGEETYLCPCGGTGQYDVAYGMNVCYEQVACSGECAARNGDLYYPSQKTATSYTNNSSTNCDQGYSWYTSIGTLEEQMKIGPRSNMAGTDGSTIWTLNDSECTPIMSVQHHCMTIDCEAGTCLEVHDPSYVGTSCHGTAYCTTWVPDNGSGDIWSFLAWGQGETHQGCLDASVEIRSGSYTTLSADVDTVISVGEVETTFEGSWVQSTFSGNGQHGTTVSGWTTDCIECNTSSELSGSESHGVYTFTELSYGVGGWWTVVTEDDRFAILIPKLNLSATASSWDGVASGTIVGTTTMYLRIVDDAEHDYEIADDIQSYVIASVPSGRSDLGVAPCCSNPRDIPSDISLRGFHWYEEFDWVFTAFLLDNDFHAELVRKVEGTWTEEDMSAFETFVEVNSLEDYTMYLVH